MNLITLLALIAAEPTLLPLWAVLVFAAGMYPVGMLFSCTPCCRKNPCDLCTEGTLPDTLTVAFSGLAEKVRGPSFITLGFEACHGSGAAAIVTAPTGDPPGDLEDAGPITAVELTNGGSGYASLGRVAPTLSAYANSFGGGTGAEFSVSTQLAQDECGRDYWKVSSVVAKAGGSGYSDGDQIVVTVSEGDTVGQDAVITLFTTRSEPTLTPSVQGSGSGADLSVVLSQNTGTPDTWRVASVTVNDGGSGYTNGSEVVFELGEGDAVDFWSTAYGTIVTSRIEPTPPIVPFIYGNYPDGTGAVLTPTIAPLSTTPGQETWTVASVAIDEPGSGYAVNDEFWAWGEGFGGSTACIVVVTEVDANGGITAFSLPQGGGEFYKDSGEIASVEVFWGGHYYKGGGAVGATVVSDGGIYYREDASLPVHVAAVTVTITQAAPSDGEGAELSAEVDDDPSSPTFGQIVSLTIDDGGDGYLAHFMYDSCFARLDGRSFVLKRGENWMFGSSCGLISPCEYFYATQDGECVLQQDEIRVKYNGPSAPMEVTLIARQFGSSSVGYQPTRCESDRSEPAVTASAGGTAVLSASVTPNPGVFQTWGVESISVISGGSGYPDSGEVSVNVPPNLSPLPHLYRSDEIEKFARAYFITSRTAPAMQAFPPYYPGVAVSLGVQLAESTDDAGRPVWSVVAVTVDSGGSGYVVGGNVAVYTTDGTTVSPATASIAAVSETGAIQSVTVTSGGKFYKNTGVIEKVVVCERGAYFNASPRTGLTRPNQGNTVVGSMLADANVTNCSEMNVTATGGSGVPPAAVATITSGGEMAAPSPAEKDGEYRIITNDELRGLTIEVEWEGESYTFYMTGSNMFDGEVCIGDSLLPPWSPICAPEKVRLGSAGCCGVFSSLFVRGEHRTKTGDYIDAEGGPAFYADAIFSDNVVQMTIWPDWLDYGCNLAWNAVEMKFWKTKSRRDLTWNIQAPVNRWDYCFYESQIAAVPTDPDGVPNGTAVLGQFTRLSPVGDAEHESFCGSYSRPTVRFSRLP
jgi:hypothetical protein